MRETHDPFPLTSALSLGERANRRQSVEESETAGMFESRNALHPLPSSLSKKAIVAAVCDRRMPSFRENTAVTDRRYNEHTLFQQAASFYFAITTSSVSSRD